jgi:hypothetical protein
MNSDFFEKNFIRYSVPECPGHIPYMFILRGAPAPVKKNRPGRKGGGEGWTAVRPFRRRPIIRFVPRPEGTSGNPPSGR